MPRIALLFPDATPVLTKLSSDRVQLGRGSDCQFLLADATVSRHHAELRRVDQAWELEDLGSRNGTFLNGRRLETPAWLEAGDRLTLGGVELVFDPPSEAALRTSTFGPGHADATAASALLGGSEPMTRVRELVRRFAPSDATVLVRGESGTGKELVARALHESSKRPDGPFVIVNCPALPGSLVEAELFGTERGVATGVDGRPGLAEAADGGTLFLDEVGDLEAGAQAKLLRFLQDHAVQRVGSRKSVALDVRVLAATHHDLEKRVEDGLFRRDLYHRLEVASLQVPPLRERLDDLSQLCEHFLGLHCAGEIRLSDEAMALLRGYDFPGNVRELEHAIQRGVLLAEGGVVGAGHLPRLIREGPKLGMAPVSASPDAAALWQRVTSGGECFWTAIREPFLRRELSRADARALVAHGLARVGGSYRELAEQLGLGDEYRKLVDFLRNNDLQPSAGD